MKKNILIAILISIIIILVVKILNPSVVTQRKINNKNLNQERFLESVNEKTLENEIDQAAKSPLIPEFRIQNDEQDYQPEISNNRYQQDREYYPSEPPKPEDNHITFRNIEPKIFEHNLTLCSPYNEKLSTTYMGINMKYSIEILGWVGDKCVLNFNADILGLDSSFDDSTTQSSDTFEVFGFAPKVRCEFTKQQLLYVGDNVLEESKSDRRMLKNPDEIKFPDFKDMSFSDMRLLQIILNDKACKVVNTDDFVRIFRQLFEF